MLSHEAMLIDELLDRYNEHIKGLHFPGPHRRNLITRKKELQLKFLELIKEYDLHQKG